MFGFDFDRLRSGPFEGPAIVKPPALPGEEGDCSKRGHTLKVDVSGRLFFPLCKGFINAQSVMPVKNYASMPKT